MPADVSNVIDVEAEDRLVEPAAPTTAELAECTCPDFCERDHDTD